VQNAGYLHGRRVQGAGYLSEDAKIQNDGYLVEGYGVLATWEKDAGCWLPGRRMRGAGYLGKGSMVLAT
jgi:hypothetical protein